MLTLDDRDRGRREGCRRQTPVLIVDGLEIVLVGLRTALAREPWVQSCVTTDSPRQALALLSLHAPRLVLVNTSINGTSGLELSRRIRVAYPAVKVVLMSGRGHVSPAISRAYGASAFVSQLLPVCVLLSVVRSVANGDAELPAPTAASSTSSQLSARELDVLQCLAAGMSNAEAGEQLNLSRHTVKQHASVVYRKLGVRNRAQAAARAQQLGLAYEKAASVTAGRMPADKTFVV